MNGRSRQSHFDLVWYLDKSIYFFFEEIRNDFGRLVSRVREGFLLKRGRLLQTAGEGCTRWRKFERCSGLEDGARQNWWQRRQPQGGGRQFRVVGFW